MTKTKRLWWEEKKEEEKPRKTKSPWREFEDAYVDREEAGKDQTKKYELFNTGGQSLLSEKGGWGGEGGSRFTVIKGVGVVTST